MKTRLLIIGIGFLAFGFVIPVSASEINMNIAPLSYFGYYDDHGNKVTKLVVGEEYFIKAKFFWPESHSQPYEFFAEINDYKNHKVIERLFARGMVQPNDDVEVEFSWIPKETGNFRNYSELWATDTFSVITYIPQYDFEVVESTQIQDINYNDFRNTGNPKECWYQENDGTMTPCKIDSTGPGMIIDMGLYIFWPYIILGIILVIIFIVWRKRR